MAEAEAEKRSRGQSAPGRQSSQVVVHDDSNDEDDDLAILRQKRSGRVQNRTKVDGKDSNGRELATSVDVASRGLNDEYVAPGKGGNTRNGFKDHGAKRVSGRKGYANDDGSDDDDEKILQEILRKEDEANGGGSARGKRLEYPVHDLWAKKVNGQLVDGDFNDVKKVTAFGRTSLQREMVSPPKSASGISKKDWGEFEFKHVDRNGKKSSDVRAATKRGPSEFFPDASGAESKVKVAYNSVDASAVAKRMAVMKAERLEKEAQKERLQQQANHSPPPPPAVTKNSRPTQATTASRPSRTPSRTERISTGDIKPSRGSQAKRSSSTGHVNKSKASTSVVPQTKISHSSKANPAHVTGMQARTSTIAASKRTQTSVRNTPVRNVLKTVPPSASKSSGAKGKTSVNAENITPKVSAVTLKRLKAQEEKKQQEALRTHQLRLKELDAAAASSSGAHLPVSDEGDDDSVAKAPAANTERKENSTRRQPSVKPQSVTPQIVEDCDDEYDPLLEAATERRDQHDRVSAKISIINPRVDEYSSDEEEGSKNVEVQSPISARQSRWKGKVQSVASFTHSSTNRAGRKAYNPLSIAEHCESPEVDCETETPPMVPDGPSSKSAPGASSRWRKPALGLTAAASLWTGQRSSHANQDMNVKVCLKSLFYNMCTHSYELRSCVVRMSNSM